MKETINMGTGMNDGLTITVTHEAITTSNTHHNRTNHWEFGTPEYTARLDKCIEILKAQLKKSRPKGWRKAMKDETERNEK